MAGTFVLMMVGWLFFRETNPDYLLGFLRLSPRARAPGPKREFGLHLFVLAATWSLPLMVNDLWALAPGALDAVQAVDRGALGRPDARRRSGHGGRHAGGLDARAAEPGDI